MKQKLLLICMLLGLVLQGISQDLTVSGTVKDDSDKPVEGATVAVKGKSAAATTDASGNFTLKAQKGAIVTVSHISYEKLELKITGEQLNIALTSLSKKMDDVVVVGYGSQRKKDLTGSVSSVSAKDFKDQPVTNVSQVLQGRASGVQVMSNAGSPGGDVSVRIRGNNSIKGNNNPLYVIDGFVGADYTSINPADIASVEILKDASATAIYGSRGANGVVLITTKRGRSGKPTVEFTSRFTSATASKKMNLMNAADYAITANEKSKASNTNPLFTQAQIDSFKVNGGTDWQDEIFRTAPTKEYQLTVSGGGDKANYYIGGNYLDQQGILINTGYKRYSLRTNLQSQLSSKTSLYMNSFLTRQERKNVGGDAGRWSPVTQACSWAPTMPVYNANGNFIVNDAIGSISTSPVAILLNQERSDLNNNANVLLGLKYEFFKGLTLDISGAANYTNIQGLNYTGVAANQNQPANASRSSLESIALQNTNNLTYTHLFNKVHRLSATAVYEVQTFKSNGFSASGNNLTFPNLTYYNLSQAATYGVGTNYSNYGLTSWLGRVNYAFKDKYLVTASVRRDGSSKFQEGKQFSTFPSIGAGWKLSEEDFIKQLGIFHNLKLRAGYGLTGSQAINPYQTMTAYNNVSTSFTTGTVVSGIILGNPGNKNLKWETTKQYDLGLDADFFHGRLTFSMDYYNKHTKDLLMDVRVPAYGGGGSSLFNVGAMKNSGYEFTLGGTPVASKGFNWNTTFNFSILKNKVASLNNGQNLLFTGSKVGAGLSTQSEFVLIPGESLGAYWGLTYLGTWKPNEATEAAKFNNVPGDARYQDLNGDNKIDGSDYHVIGHGLPKYTAGWNNTVTYKNFTLNLFVQAVGGNDKLNYLYGSALTANADIRQATLVDIKNRYIAGVNETSDIPGFSSTNKVYMQSTAFMEDGSFIRLKNISFSYDLPMLWQKLNPKLFVSGTNLFTLTHYRGYDPESSSVTSGAGSDVNQGIDYGSYPNAKSFTVGVTLRF